MTKQEVEQVWKAYLEAYGNVSSVERESLLRVCVSDDVVSTNPGEESRGFDDFVRHVEQFQQRLPGAYFVNNKLLFHHNQILSEWTLHKSDGTPLRTANTYGILDDQGRLKQLTGFF